MPARLRPTAPIAADAILVGDPGRALMLAQKLLEQPRMCNHARGLWGYTGRTSAGAELTLQSTGMGGPSAALVLADLAELGVCRAVRVGTCTAIDPQLEVGELLAVTEAHAWGGPGGGKGEPMLPDEALATRLERELGDEARTATVASLDTLSGVPLTKRNSGEGGMEIGGEAADMQTAALFASGRSLEVALAAVLIVSETADGEPIGDEELEAAAKRAGKAAVRSLSP
jgi:uridine phosphorylase